ncbi:hypothetical protein D3C76_1108840 [compost metagenome]
MYTFVCIANRIHLYTKINNEGWIPMRRRSTSQATNTEKDLTSSSHHKGKRREINNLDRAESSGNRNSNERGRTREHQRDGQGHHERSRRHEEWNNDHNKEEFLAPRHIDRDDKNIQSAKTFRRGRIIIFLRQLQVKRSTLVQQLQQPEFKSIEQVISGELKAVDEMIQQFTHLFELREIESEDSTNP